MRWKMFMMIALLAMPVAAEACGGMGHGGKGDAYFERMDTNGDGSISAEEHRAHADAMFRQLDANGDGSVSKAEHDQFRTTMRERYAGKSCPMDPKDCPKDAKNCPMKKSCPMQDGAGAKE